MFYDVKGVKYGLASRLKKHSLGSADQPLACLNSSPGDFCILLTNSCNELQLYHMNNNECAKFGDFIRSKRVSNGITAREASLAVGMLPSNFSKLEHGALTPPREKDKLEAVADAIGVKDVERSEFFDLASKANNSTPVDIADIISRNDAIPLLLRTIGNKRLTNEQINRLVQIVRGEK